MSDIKVYLLGDARTERLHVTWLFQPDLRLQLLAYLALRSQWLPRERLQALFWPDRVVTRTQNSLRQLLSRVQALDGLPALEIERTRVRWTVWNDVSAFEMAVREERWADALNHYGGPLLRGIQADGEYGTWLEQERSRLGELWRTAVLKRAEELERQGARLQAADTLDLLLRGDELDELALHRLVQVLLDAGEQMRALSVYQAFAERLNREYHLAPSSELSALHQKIQMGSGGTDAEGPGTAAQPLADLPPRPGPCIGRDGELSQIAQHFSRPECRLLTLTGLGGIGKTRLALEVAHLAAEEARERVRFVRLEALSTSAQIGPALAETLHLLSVQRGDVVGQVARALKEQPTLLVLDNFEHLPGGADVVLTLLQACPDLRVLVTSRVPVGLESEWLLPVGGLHCPEPGSTDYLSGQYYDAVELFLDRVRRSWPTFDPGPASFPALATICQLVGGSPLGLELAATWVRSLSLDDIAAELQQNLDFLDSDHHGVSGRHRSLRAVFLHSWQLLSIPQQQALSRLSVFRGGCRLSAARQVAGVSIAVLAGLVRTSLVQLGADGRYRLHALIRQYLTEQLQASPDDARAVHTLHSEHYLHVLAGAVQTVDQHGVANTVGVLGEELDNLRAAWSWALATESPVTLRPVLAHWSAFCQLHAGFQEGVRSFAEAALLLTRRGSEYQALLGEVLIQQTWFMMLQGHMAAARDLALQGLALTSPGSPAALNVHHLLGTVAHSSGQYEVAATHYTVAAELAAALGREDQRAELLTSLSGELAALGRYDEARHHVVLAQALYRASGQQVGLASSLAMQGHLATLAGQLDQAQTILEEGLTLARRYDRHTRVLHVLHCLAEVAFSRGDYTRANQLCEEQLALVQAWDNEAYSLAALTLLARISVASRADLMARTFFKRSLRLALAGSRWPRLLEGLLYLAEWHLQRGRPLQAVPYCQAALAHPSTEDRFRRLAAHLLASVEAAEPDFSSNAPSLTLDVLAAHAMFEL